MFDERVKYIRLQQQKKLLKHKIYYTKQTISFTCSFINETLNGVGWQSLFKVSGKRSEV